MIPKQERLPNLIIIGAMKCATTSLHYYLSLHPEISMSRVKELSYFGVDNWYQGIEWYKSHFTDGSPIRGEASPNYTNYPQQKDVATRMYTTIPEAKLIYIVRDPIKRIFSHYIHHFTRGDDKRTLVKALQKLDDNNSYVARSKYYMQLEQYLAYYPKQQIFILTTEELYTHRVETLKKVFNFIGVSPSFKSAKFDHIKHPTREKRCLNKIGQQLTNFSENHINRYHPGVQRYLVRMLCYPFSQRVEIPYLNESLRQDLEQVLQEDVQKLRAFTGYSFSEWSI